MFIYKSIFNILGFFFFCYIGSNIAPGFEKINTTYVYCTLYIVFVLRVTIMQHNNIIFYNTRVVLRENSRGWRFLRVV